MKKQEAILRMMIPMAKSLFEKRADWDEIDQMIDSCGELYDRIANAYPEEDDEEDDFEDDLQGYGMSSDWDEEDERKYKEQFVEQVEKKIEHEFNIVHGKFDETVTKEEGDLIDKYMEKQSSYIPFEEEKKQQPLKSTGSIL